MAILRAMAKSGDPDAQRPDSPPMSRFSRLARLGALAPRALPLAKEAMRRAMGGTAKELDVDQRAELRATAKKTADAMLKTLGEMKGLPLKLGQMASYIEGLAPPGYEERFQEVLKKLQQKAPPLSREAAHRVIVEEFGAAPDELFAEWDPDPFAAASVGQVHRAKTRDGRLVAVKVQYPGIDKAIANDLKSLGMLEQMIAPVGRRYHTKETLAEVRAVFLAELDYGAEAENLEMFRRIHAEDRMVVVPQVVHSLTTKRVITMELIGGVDYATFLENASEEDKNAAGETIWRFMFRALYKHGVLYADPHPGNYRFLGGGRVAFLDYGCVRVLPRPLVEGMKGVVAATMDSDWDRFYQLCVSVLGYDPTDEAGFKLYTEYTKFLMQPFVQVPFHHTPAVAREAVGFLVRHGKELVLPSSGALPNLPKPINMPPESTFVNRLQWGLSSVMGGLGAKGDYRALSEPWIRGETVPPPS